MKTPSTQQNTRTYSMKTLKLIGTTFLTYFAVQSSTFATEQFEFSAMVGQMYGSDLVSNEDNDISVDTGTNIALGIAWQKTNNGQGQVLINRVSHDVEYSDDVTNALDITYAHFNGVALFRQQNYVTTFSLGFGGAHFDVENGSDEFYPSASVAFGTRYEFSNNMALVTELRAYATLVDEDDNLFCKGDTCAINFDDSVYLDSSISVGIAIKF